MQEVVYGSLGMSIYNWMMEKFFDTYEEWKIKSTSYDGKGFHIIGIDNTLKAMQSGYNMYMDLYPPHAINGCTVMKARLGKPLDRLDLLLEIDGKSFRIGGVTYPDAVQMMRSFIKKHRLPDPSLYVEVDKTNGAVSKSQFAQLVRLLLGDSKRGEVLISKAKVDSMEEFEDAWWELYETLLSVGKAVEISWKTELEDILLRAHSLADRKCLPVDEMFLKESQSITDWCAHLNTIWEKHTLACMDIGTDTFVLMVLSHEEFKKAQELARDLLHRIDLAERF